MMSHKVLLTLLSAAGVAIAKADNYGGAPASSVNAYVPQSTAPSSTAAAASTTSLAANVSMMIRHFS